MTLNITALLTRPSFSGYVQQMMIRRNELIKSGAMVVDPRVQSFVASGGNTTTLNSWQPIGNTTTAAQVATNDTTVGDSQAIGTSQEVMVRVYRGQAWAAGDLVEAIAGDDPLDNAARELVDYWNGQIQAAFIATWQGVVADNVANDSNDMVNDISDTFNLGTTTFQRSVVADTRLTAGDAMRGFTTIMMHSVVYNRLEKENLIDFIRDSENNLVEYYAGMRIIVDDDMPVSSGDYRTWLFGPGATVYGNAPTKTPVAVQREELQGTVGGMEYLVSRQQWCIHPRGFAYTGTATGAGPANTVLDDAASWNRVFASRKQIKFAELVTTETA